MRKTRSLFVCIFMLMIITLMGCRRNDYEKENKNETVYIGDNSKVVQIVNQLPYPNEISYSKIAIQSDKEPYELKVFLNHIPENSEGLQECANIAFDKIFNMGIISFYDKDGNVLIKSYERQ